MYQKFARKTVIVVGAIVFSWLTMRFLIPIGLPFALGALLAFAAEPTVRLLHRRLHMSRTAATALAVSVVFLLSGTVLTLLLAALLRQLGRLGGILPELAQTVAESSALLQDWLLQLVQRLPETLQEVLSPMVQTLFSGGSALLEQAAAQLPRLAATILGAVSQGLFVVVTGVISGYMISVRLPALRKWLALRLPPALKERYLPALRTLRKALGGWILAQLKLAGIAGILLSAGFLLLQIPNPLLWAGLVTLVDAFPILGVGTVLIPWSAVYLLQGDYFGGIGLLGLYAVIWLIRSVLEPKLIGKELGIDPLVTLICIYAGFRLFGFMGLLLAPILAMILTQICRQTAS